MAYRRKARSTSSRTRVRRSSARGPGRVRMARPARRGASRANTLRIELVQPGANAVARPFSLAQNAPAERPKGSKF